MVERTLSKSAAILVALAAEKAMSAYEMVRVLKAVNLSRWFPVSESSIYVTARNLEERGLLAGKAVQEGNMPEKTVYAVTGAGRKALARTLNDFLSAGDAGNPEFDIAMLFLCALPRDEALACLERREARLVAEIDRARKEHARLSKDAGIGFAGTLMVRHNQYLKEAELKTVRELAREVSDARRWDWFVTDLLARMKEAQK